MRSLRVTILVSLLALALAAPAAAAPDRTAAVSAASTTFNWSPDPATGSYLTFSPLINYDPANCSKNQSTYCDITLVHVDSKPGTPVKLDVSATEFSSGSDYDLYVYKSNSTGTLGDEVEGTEGTAVGGFVGEDEIWTHNELEPGYYLVYIVYFLVDDDTFKGTIKVTGAVPNPGGTPPPSGGGGEPPPPSGGGGTPPPSGSPPPSSGGGSETLPFRAASTIGSAKKAKKKRSLSFRVSAEKAISDLVVRLVVPKGKTLGSVKVKSLKAGASTLKLKLSRKVAKKLKRGTYQLVATGTVDGRQLSATQPVKLKK